MRAYSVEKAYDSTRCVDDVRSWQTSEPGDDVTATARSLLGIVSGRGSASDACALGALHRRQGGCQATSRAAGRPDAESLRTALRKYVLLPESKRPAATSELTRAIRWLEGASLDLADLSETKTARLALDAIALRLDGKAASANTVRRKRAVLHAVLEYAVELEEVS
jgi:hypothetical protein